MSGYLVAASGERIAVSKIVHWGSQGKDGTLVYLTDSTDEEEGWFFNLPVETFDAIYEAEGGKS